MTTGTGTTAIRAPAPDLANHQTVLVQLKEVAEVAQRQRGDPLDSFVKLRELVNAGVIKFTAKTVLPGKAVSSMVSNGSTIGTQGLTGETGATGATGAVGATGASATSDPVVLGEITTLQALVGTLQTLLTGLQAEVTTLQSEVSGGPDIAGEITTLQVEVSGIQAELAAGPQGLSFVFTQTTATPVWTIVHNLGRFPSVIVVDAEGDQVEADVNYVDISTVRVTFSIPFAGSAYLN